MDLGGALEIARTLGSSGLALGWTLVSSALTWGLLAAVVAVGLFFLGVRGRWVDPGRRVLWVRVLWGLIIFLVFFPAATGIGVVASLRSKVIKVLLAEARERGVTRGLGSLLLFPLVVAHGSMTLSEEIKSQPGPEAPPRPEAKAEPSGVRAVLSRTLGREGRRALWDRVQGVASSGEELAGGSADVTFLLDGSRRTSAVRGLTDRLARRALDETPGGQRLKEHALGRLVAPVVAGLASKEVADRVAFYDRIVGELRAGPDGKLTWAQATGQAGESFLDATVLPLVKKPFDTLLIELGLAAVLPPLLLIGIVQIVRVRRSGREPVEAEAPPKAA